MFRPSKTTLLGKMHFAKEAQILLGQIAERAVLLGLLLLLGRCPGKLHFAML